MRILRSQKGFVSGVPKIPSMSCRRVDFWPLFGLGCAPLLLKRRLRETKAMTKPKPTFKKGDLVQLIPPATAGRVVYATKDGDTVHVLTNAGLRIICAPKHLQADQGET